MFVLKGKGGAYAFYMKEIAYYNGETAEAEKLKVPFLERTAFFGDAVYDVTYAISHGAFALKEHVERLYKSAARVGLEPPLAPAEFAELVRSLIRRCDDEELLVYMQFSGGAGRREHARRTSPSVWVYIFPKKIESREKRYRLISAPDIRYGLCGIKTVNLLPNVLAANAAAQTGADECVFVRGGFVTECAHSNVSMLKGGELVAPPARGQILEGISLSHLIKTCAEEGVPVSRRFFSLEELMGADEVLITSSGVPLCTCERIDGVKVGGKDGRTAERLADVLYGQYALCCALDGR